MIAYIFYGIAIGMLVGVLIGFRVGFNQAKQRAVDIAQATYSMDDLVARTEMLTSEQHLAGLRTNVQNTYRQIRDL